MPPDSPYLSFHQSLTDELHALKNRVRSLVRYIPDEDDEDDEDEVSKVVRSHWPTDGEWKEAAIRTVLRRHLLDAAPVGRGFIVNANRSSSQIDVLIPKPSQPTLFRDGDLLVVTPNAVSAVAEVKTELRSKAAIYTAIKKLAKVGMFCKEMTKQPSPWLGLFVYEGENNAHEDILDGVCKAYAETKVVVNCVSFGRDTFVRFWERGEYEKHDGLEEIRKALWKSYQLPNLAPSYFIGNVVDAICSVDSSRGNYAWFAYSDGKRDGGTMLGSRFLEACREDSGER